MVHRPLPALRGHWLRGISRSFRRDPLQFLLAAGREHDVAVQLRFSPFQSMTLITDPGLVEHVLVEHPERYPKIEMRMKPLQAAIQARFRRRLGVPSSATPLAFNRKLVAPLFTRANLNRYMHLAHKRIDTLANEWSQLGAGHAFDLVPGLNRLALGVAIETLLGSTIDQTRVDTIIDAMTRLNDAITNLSSAGVRLPMFVPTRENRALSAALGDLADVTYDYYQAVRGGPTPSTPSLFSLPDKVLQRSGATPLDVLAAGIVMLIAGHETSWTSMAWTLGALAQRPELGRAVAQEAEQVLGPRAFDPAMLTKLTQTRAVLSESLRLRPPSWISIRQAAHDDHWRGFQIPRGTRLMITPYVLQLLKRSWDDPESFRPERFAAGKTYRPGVYLPFGHGRRNCIGKHFGSSESTLLVATMMRRFRFEPVPGHDYSPQARLTIQPRHGMKLRIFPRGTTTDAAAA